MPEAAAAGAAIHGSVELAEGTTVGSEGVLFVIARNVSAGPPLAVKRLPVSSFPVEFEIGPQDMMIAGQPFRGPIWLTARVDTDGNAMTREAGALSATSPEPLEAGASGVELVLAAAGAPEQNAPSAEPTAAAPIRGVIRLRDGLSIPREAVLFLVARSTGGGPPLAAKRLAPGPFPLAFEIGPADTMIAGRPFHGPVLLSARLDFDGDALSKSPEEPHIDLAEPVLPGASGVELSLAPGP